MARKTANEDTVSGADQAPLPDLLGGELVPAPARRSRAAVRQEKRRERAVAEGKAQANLGLLPRGDAERLKAMAKELKKGRDLDDVLAEFSPATREVEVEKTVYLPADVKVKRVKVEVPGPVVEVEKVRVERVADPGWIIVGVAAGAVLTAVAFLAGAS